MTIEASLFIHPSNPHTPNPDKLPFHVVPFQRLSNVTYMTSPDSKNTALLQISLDTLCRAVVALVGSRDTVSLLLVAFATRSYLEYSKPNFTFHFNQSVINAVFVYWFGKAGFKCYLRIGSSTSPLMSVILRAPTTLLGKSCGMETF